MKTLALLLANTATAGMITINLGPTFEVKSNDGWASSVATHYSPTSKTSNGFLTFCLEYKEYFYPGVPYQYNISSAAVHGGKPTSDTLSVGTGFLYNQFAHGYLGVGTLQKTIWWLEGEQSYSPSIYDTLLVNQFGSLANATLDSYHGKTAKDWGVYAINVGTPPNYPGQDQLVYLVPDSINTLSTLLLCATGFLVKKQKMF